MLVVYETNPDGGLSCSLAPAAALAGAAAVWIDLLRADADEERLVETATGADVPTARERDALEISSRFDSTPEELYLTANLVSMQDERPVSGPVTFILRGGRLITSRDLEPRAFQIGDGRASTRLPQHPDGRGVLLALLEGVVERLADLLDRAAEDADALSDDVFGEDGAAGDLRGAVRRVGRIGALNAKCQESLASLSRAVAFTIAAAKLHGLDSARLRELGRDLRELEHYAGGLADRVEFLLEAALGLIGAQQNQSMRVMSIVAVLFLPPTLIASVYGMNFVHMPELGQTWGYPLALGLMVASAALIFLISKLNRWL